MTFEGLLSPKVLYTSGLPTSPFLWLSKRCFYETFCSKQSELGFTMLVKKNVSQLLNTSLGCSMSAV
jgi:hypothetical protein